MGSIDSKLHVHVHVHDPRVFMIQC